MALLGWIGWVMAAGPAAQETVKESKPAYELTLPVGYRVTDTREEPRRYHRTAGPEDWARLTIRFGPLPEPLRQNPDGRPFLTDIYPKLGLSPEAKSVFSTTRWREVEIGVVEFRANLRDLQGFGMATIVPLRGQALAVWVEGPVTLEKEIRADFQMILATLKGPTDWVTAELRKRQGIGDLVEWAGLGLAALYLGLWALAFRNDVLKAHLFRTAWLIVTGLLLFFPVTMQSDFGVQELILNLVLPLMLFSMAGRRIKLAIDMGD